MALHHYLDDFLPVFKPSVSIQMANAAVDWIETLAEELGLSFQPEKKIWQTTCLEFLGLELDSSAMGALPQEKMNFLQCYLLEWHTQLLLAEGHPRAGQFLAVFHSGSTTWLDIHQRFNKLLNDFLE